MSQVPELTLPELLDQPWIKRIARVMSFIAVLAFGLLQWRKAPPWLAVILAAVAGRLAYG